MQMDDIQSWWEVPSIAHFCSLFRAAFNLLDFDIEELEEALLTDGTEDSGSSLLQELIVRLLCGCYGSHDISTFNYQMFLRRLFRQKCQEYGRDNPFNTDMDFQFLPLRTKVEILHALCDFRLDADDVQDLLKNLEADSLRVEPLGHDENKSAYWYFYGTRLYREDYPRTRKKTKEKRKKGKEEKKKRKHSKYPMYLNNEEKGIWQVVCFTEEDWDKIAKSFKGSRCKAEKELYHTLSEDFLPEIPRLFAEKERMQRKRMLEYQPRRQSSRLEKLKQMKEEEETLQKKVDQMEEERRKREQEKKEKHARVRKSRVMKESRVHRTSVRSQSGTTSRTNSESGSVGSLSDSKSAQSSTTFVGRQTNNSLSSATGQIVIQQGLRRKLRSSQVFRQTEEDLQTGMYKILECVKNHEDAWPFMEPVDEQYAPRYYSIISKPMDLQHMEDKLDEGEYLSFSQFRSDFQLIVDNCRKYNGTDNEYTEMVGNLQQAFQSAVDRYLESETSSDDEVAVEFIEKIPEKTPLPKRIPPKKKKTEIIVEEEPVSSPSPAPSIPSSPPPSSDEEKVPDLEKEQEEKPDAAVEPPDSDSNSTKGETDANDTPNQNTVIQKKKNGPKNAPDIEALELATEQTLKDINKWLDDTPRYSEFSSASNSPSHFISTEEYEPGSKVENEYRRNLKIEKPSRCKDSKDNGKRKSSKDPTKQMRRREVQRTIERLQPGKSKGNLISNIQSASKVSEEGPPGKPKDSRSSLLTVVDEATPKLSLGTVLGTDVLGFGQNKHNFDNETKEEVKSVSVIEEVPKQELDFRPKTPESPAETENMEEVPDKREKEEIEVKPVSKDFRSEKTMPNLSAWFKAFGTPKSSSGLKKRSDSFQEGSSMDINNEDRRDFTIVSPPDKNITVEATSVIVHDVRQPVVVETKLEEPESRHYLENKTNGEDMPSPLPLTSSNPITPRQRRLSTGSSVSERSSFSQDLMDPIDVSSPRLSLEDRLGAYSAPYPSPLHQSPLPTSPVTSSPRLDDGPKFGAYPPINGSIRVGFYQDTSFAMQKSSPEKTSQSPKEPPRSPFPTYTPRMYPPHDPGGFVAYQDQHSGPPTPVSDGSYDNTSYSSVLKTYYDTSKPLTDQYRAARTQEPDDYSPGSPTTEEVSRPPTSVLSSPQPSTELKSSHTSAILKPKFSSLSSSSTARSTGPKLSATVFPVKKRLYSEIDVCCSPQAMNRYAPSPGTPPPAHSQSISSALPPESAVIIENAHQNRLLSSPYEYSDKIAGPSEKIYSTRNPTLDELDCSVSKKSEHTQPISKKNHIYRTQQCNSNNVFDTNDRMQQASPETVIGYTSKCNPFQSSPPEIKAQTPPPFVPRASAIKRHSGQNNSDNIPSDDDDCRVIKIQPSSVPVITSSRTSNRQSFQDFSNKSESYYPSGKVQIIKPANSMQTVTEATESIPSDKLRNPRITSSPNTEHLKPSSNAALPGNDMNYHRGPFSPLPPSPVGMGHLAMHGNLGNLSHIVERFPTNERLLSGLTSPSSPYFREKRLSPQYGYRQNALPSSVPCTSPSSSPMNLLSQPSPSGMSVAYSHDGQLSPSSIPFNRSITELPSVLPNKVTNMQINYEQSAQDLSTVLPAKSSSPVRATLYNRPVSDLPIINSSKTLNVNSQAAYRCINEIPSVPLNKEASPVDLKSYNQTVTDLSTTLSNKGLLIPLSCGATTSHSQSSVDYSQVAGKSDNRPTAKPSRKRKTKQAVTTNSEVPAVTTSSNSTAFQQYIGLSSSPTVSESSSMVLKSPVLNGSAFNFGPAHPGLALYGTEKDSYTGYLEDYRTTPTSYYIPVSEPSHDKMNAAAHPSTPTPTLPFPFSSHSRPPPYALAQAFINHQSGLVDPSGSPTPLYQQYLQRHSEEILRHSGTSMVHIHQGILPPPAGYTASYALGTALRQPYENINRHSWI